MRIYLASWYGSKARLQQIAKQVEARGHVVTSTWLTQEESGQGLPPLDVAKVYAKRDLKEITESDLLIIDIHDENPRGGREVEYGYAMALGNRLWVVGNDGKPRNVFHTLAERTYRTWPETLADLAVNIPVSDAA